MFPNRKNITIHSENKIITAAHRRMFEQFLGDCCMKSEDRKLQNLKVTKSYELFHDNHEKDLQYNTQPLVLTTHISNKCYYLLLIRKPKINSLIKGFQFTLVLYLQFISLWTGPKRFDVCCRITYVTHFFECWLKGTCASYSNFALTMSF